MLPVKIVSLYYYDEILKPLRVDLNFCGFLYNMTNFLKFLLAVPAVQVCISLLHLIATIPGFLSLPNLSRGRG